MIDTIAVVVPAANEEQTITACLDALWLARHGAGCEVRVVVVLDACDDGTAELAARFRDVELVRTTRRNVGHARRVGAAHALRGLDPEHTLLASTDADSIVPPGWLAVLCEASDAADLVLGVVLPDDGLAPAVETAWHSQHRLVEGHAHVHAANLAMRAGAYTMIGGWRPLRSHEDEDLARRTQLAGMRIRRTARAPVRTSVRAFGRAPYGFSSYLRALGHEDDAPDAQLTGG